MEVECLSKLNLYLSKIYPKFNINTDKSQRILDVFLLTFLDKKAG